MIDAEVTVNKYDVANTLHRKLRKKPESYLSVKEYDQNGGNKSRTC